MLDTSHFTGTTTWWRHPLNLNITYTDGARYVAEKAGAYWLLDQIALSGYPHTFQKWDLSVVGTEGEIVVEDGDENVIHRHKLSYTDFPEPGVTLWFVDGVILLPSEY